MGPIMLDVHGTSLSEEDKEILEHPLVGGVILFTRNYQSPEQVSYLVSQIRQAAKSDILLAVDHEGGRIQRFREQFSRIPAMGDILTFANGDMNLAANIAKSAGMLMATEVQAVGIDISFAPVLDVNGISEVIGDRAFHHTPEKIIPLASAFVDGMHAAGMKATGKHFPGHGSVLADSHFALPIDERAEDEILSFDLSPFKHLIATSKVDALMPAHVIYPKIDDLAVGFSRKWLQQILRQELAFDGVIFSDDLSMEGAASVGGYVERAEASQQAGCDMLLVCNNRQGAIDILDNARLDANENSTRRLQKLLKTNTTDWKSLASNNDWLHASRVIAEYTV